MPLLRNGNQKLGPSIGTFSLPAVETCPGLTSQCASVCYAKRYTRRLNIDYTPELEATRAPAFVSSMVAEAAWKSVVRVHVSGDFPNVAYVAKWKAIASQASRTLFYGYTMSWRMPDLNASLEGLASLPNFRLMWSCDAQTGVPGWMAGCDVAWLAMSDLDLPPRTVGIVFRRKTSTVLARMSRSIVCPAENGIVDNGVTCQRCRLCFREKM
jgi:hypothetical protein